MHTIDQVAKKSSFEVGTLVMITKRGTDYDPNGMGPQSPWMNVWHKDMDFYIGKTMVVAERPEGLFEDEGIALQNCPFTFPSNVLVVLN